MESNIHKNSTQLKLWRETQYYGVDMTLNDPVLKHKNIVGKV